MSSLASNLLSKIKENWVRASASQKWLVALLGTAFLLAVGVAYYLNQPNWVPLVSEADPKDIAAVVARLGELKVPFKPSGNGYTILVPSKERDAAKFALVQAGLPKGSTAGMELFDEPKFGATEFDRRVNYLRARQGELERTLLRNSDLEYARVHLDIPEQSVFIRNQDPVKAGVLLQTRIGRKLSQDQVRGIVNFLASSVQGLTVENVTVVDQTGRLLSSGLGDLSGQSMDTEQLRRQDEMQVKVEHQVQSMLEQVFGPGNVMARVNLELNLDASKVETVTVGQGTPKSTTTERETSAGTMGDSQGVRTPEAGAPPVYQGQTAIGSEDQWKSRVQTDYEVSNRKEVTIIAPGAVKRLSVGIVINRSDLSSSETEQVRAAVAAATGAALSSIEVAAIPFKQEVPLSLAVAPARTLEPKTLAVGLGAAAVVMLLGYAVSRRRRSDEMDDEPPLLMEMPRLQTAGTMLDVALGMPGTPGMAAGIPPESMGAFGGGPQSMPPHSPADPAAMGAHSDHDFEEGTGAVEPSETMTAQQRLEFVMKKRPKRQVVLGGQPVDDKLMEMIEDLVNNHPETCAETLRQWLKGGSAQ